MNEILYQWILLYGAIPSTLFVVVYHVLARWWETAVGRNVMLLMAALAATFDLWFLNRILDRPEWMLWALAGLVILVGSAIWWRLYLLVRAQREYQPSDRNHQHQH
jgi:hypothetical protein